MRFNPRKVRLNRTLLNWNYGSIQTELERDRERERELNQYYADPFTLELEHTHIEIYHTRHHKFPCKFTM